jgi:diguanylate cyclase (GGDEF)-like protein/PAS domain S-box-containing protein
VADEDLAGEPLLGAFIAGVADYAILTLDQSGRVLSWNAGAERLTGHRAAEIRGRHVAVLYPPDEVEWGRPQSHLADAAAHGRLQFEGWQMCADGSRFWGDVLITALYGSDRELRGFGGIIRDSTRSRQFQRELMRQALHDPLTGLPNRALLMDRMWKALTRLERHQESVAVFFVDLDGFKAVNDRFGHQAGDSVLVEVARRLRSVVRTQDTVARLSGDEFVVLCDGLPSQVPRRIQRIADRLAEALTPPWEIEGEQVALGASIGVAVTESAAQLPEKLLRQADTAMYEAKRTPGALAVQVRFFGEPGDRPAAD